jgi:hypothetical protein
MSPDFIRTIRTGAHPRRVVKTEVLTPNQVLLTDEIANEKYVGFYAERKTEPHGHCAEVCFFSARSV